MRPCLRAICAAAIGAATAAAQAGGEWHTRAPYPISLTEVSGAAIGREIFMLCGLTPTGSTRALHIYDTLTDTWRTGAPIPIEGGADHCNVAAAGGKVYLLGAIRVGSSFIDGNTYEYDPVLDGWQRVAMMLTPRGASGVAAIGSRIYVAGGLASTGSVRAFEFYDVENRQWTRLPDMPTARDHLTAQAFNGRFYAISGRAGDMRSETEEFDPATLQWRARAPIPVPRGGIGSGIAGGRVVVFGGEGPSGTPQRTFAETHAYDPAADTWTALAPMPTPRHGIYGVTHDNRIFVPGGGPSEGAAFSNAHEVFYPRPAEAPEIRAVVNPANPAGRLAPGSIASAYGVRLSTGAAAAASPASAMLLNAVRVNAGSAPLALYYASPELINLHIPYDAAGASVRLTPVNTSVAGQSIDVPLDRFAPAIFSADGTGRGQGAILVPGPDRLAGPDFPVPRSGIASIYATGLGPVARQGNLDVTVERPVVTIGGAEAEVLFSGVTPGFPGLYVVNVRLHAETAVGNAVPVTLRIGGVTSNEVTMSVIPSGPRPL